MNAQLKIVFQLLCLYGFAYSLAVASEYSQPGFYDVEHYKLDNGMRVVLKPRHNARNLSIQLKVDVGHMNFPCGKRETAHFLEHLLFTGTDQHSESQLDDIIELHGGSWNAETGNDYTLYYIDIYNKHFDVALNTLYEIITKSTLTAENVEKSRKIIFREDGGKPSRFRSWLFESGVITSAVDTALNQLFPDIQYQCVTLDNASTITREEIVKTYRDYYIAANMTLVLVGDFESIKVKQLIEQTFGGLPNKTIDHIARLPLPATFQPTREIIEGRWHPIVDSEASIYLMYRTGGIYSPEYYTLTVLESYFQTELYNRLRVEQGMSYAPSAYNYLHKEFGAFVLETDSELEDIEKNIQLIKEIITQFQQGDFDQERLENVKRKILLNAARGYESNNSFAEYYALSVEDLRRYGKYENYEANIEAVSIQDIRNATNAYFHDDNLVTAVVKPTFTYTQFYLLLIAMTGIAALVSWRVIRRIRLHHSR